MFASAKKVALAPQSPAKGKPSKPVDLIEGWEELCALDAVSKALAGLVAIKKTTIEEGPVTDLLVTRGLAAGRKPESLNPVEGDGKGSAYIAKRSTRSPLSEEELGLLSETVGEAAVGSYVETVEDRPALLAVNPAYANDEALLRKIDKALAGIKGIPEDFIVQTEAVSKTVVSDAAVNEMFKLSPEKLDAIFTVLAGISLRPVYGAGLEKAWEAIKPLIPEAESLPEKPKSRKGPPPTPVARSSAELREAFRKSAEK
jgi:hypothetical protein